MGSKIAEVSSLKEGVSEKHPVNTAIENDRAITYVLVHAECNNVDNKTAARPHNDRDNNSERNAFHRTESNK